jgi:hypothetical protein
MDRLQKAALITRLVQALQARGSWCGETHIQKATYFLQELLQVPLGLQFILYRHGPFSFDLRGDLTGLRADELLRLEPQPPPYGPKFVATERADYIQKIYSQTVARYRLQIDLVATRLGPQRVTALERLATGLFVTRDAAAGATVEARAEALHGLKPHVSPEEARAAIHELDEIIRQADALAC